MMPEYVAGKAVLCEDGIWHVRWTYASGKTVLTSYGWNTYDAARRHINLMLGVDDND